MDEESMELAAMAEVEDRRKLRPDENTGQLMVVRPPQIILDEAIKAAAALTDVLRAKKKKVIFNGEQYLEFEDWQTLGRFYGITAKVVRSRYVEYGDVHGFEATAVAIRNDGSEISSADAACLTDEEKWNTRPKYKNVYILKDGTETEDDPPKDKIVWEKTKDGKFFPKKKKIYDGEEKVPLFQLRSMSQTRAAAKALRNVLAWVVVLAGYRPTPAEEMDGMANVIDAEPTPINAYVEPREKESPAPPTAGAGADAVPLASEKQLKAINVLMSKLGGKDHSMGHNRHDIAKNILGFAEAPASLKDLTIEQASVLITKLDELTR